MSFARFDIVIVPFPFTDRPVTRRRPALVVSATAWNGASGHVVCAMITSARQSTWPHDTAVTNLTAAGLTAACVVRLKLFTLEAGLVIRRAGALAEADAAAVTATLTAVLA
jgi:mRNA interferase MazF